MKRYLRLYCQINTGSLYWFWSTFVSQLALISWQSPSLCVSPSALWGPYGSDKRSKESKQAVTIVSSFLFRSFHHWHDGLARLMSPYSMSAEASSPLHEHTGVMASLDLFSWNILQNKKMSAFIFNSFLNHLYYQWYLILVQGEIEQK